MPAFEFGLSEMAHNQNEDWERDKQTEQWEILKFWENCHGILPQKLKKQFFGHPNLIEIASFHREDVERAIIAKPKLAHVVSILRVLRMEGKETKEKKEPIILPTAEELEIDRFQTEPLDWDHWRNRA